MSGGLRPRTRTRIACESSPLLRDVVAPNLDWLTADILHDLDIRMTLRGATWLEGMRFYPNVHPTLVSEIERDVALLRRRLRIDPDVRAALVNLLEKLLDPRSAASGSFCLTND